MIRDGKSLRIGAAYRNVAETRAGRHDRNCVCRGISGKRHVDGLSGVGYDCDFSSLRSGSTRSEFRNERKACSRPHWQRSSDASDSEIAAAHRHRPDGKEGLTGVRDLY